MKKLALFLALIMIASLLAACGGNDTSDDDDDRGGNKGNWGNKIEQEDDRNDEEDKDEEDKDEESSEDETPAKEPDYFYVHGYQDGMIFGNYSTADGYVTAAINEKGKILFTLEEDRNFSFTEDYNGDERLYIGDYTLLSDNTVIDREGKTVFSLADTDFNNIYYSECLDVGFLLLSKDVNTFEETGTHYYAYNLKDGTSYKFEGTFAPMSEGHQYYFGNGIFIYSPANSGFGTKHTFINIVENKEYQGYTLDENGEKVYERLPDFYFYTEFKNSNKKAIPTVDNMFYSRKDSSLIAYNIETGEVKLTELEGTISNTIEVDKVTQVSYLYKMKMSGDSYLSDKFLLNIRTGKHIMMNDYASYDIYMHNTADDSYLAFVTNEGGGKFMTVLDKDGNRAFDPVSASSIQAYNENVIVIRTSNDTSEVYNWKGEKIDSFEAASRVTLGKDSIVLCRDIEDRECTVLRKFGEEDIVVTTLPVIEKYNVRTSEVNFYADGYYFYDSFILTDDGDVTILCK